MSPLTPTTSRTWGPHRLAVPPLPQGGEGRENHDCSAKTEDLFSLAPLGERGDRKAVGEGVHLSPHYAAVIRVGAKNRGTVNQARAAPAGGRSNEEGHFLAAGVVFDILGLRRPWKGQNRHHQSTQQHHSRMPLCPVEPAGMPCKLNCRFAALFAHRLLDASFIFYRPFPAEK